MAWAPDYVTLAQLKDFMRVSDTDDDAQLALAITAASRSVDNATGRQFGKVDSAEDRYYFPTWDIASGSWVIEVDDVHDGTGLTVATDPAGDGTWTGSVTGFVLRPRNAVVKGRPYTQVAIPSRLAAQWPPALRMCRGEEVKASTDKWGWSAVPSIVTEATLIQGSRFQMRRDSPFGVAGSPDNGGSELRLLAKLDPDVALMLTSVTRNWGAR